MTANSKNLTEINSLAPMQEVEEALKVDDQRREQKRTARQEEEQKNSSRVASLPALLRGAGATVLLAAAGAFVLQHWGEIEYISRYFSFLGFTVLLTLVGFFCGLKIKDDKSARTFLAVAAAIIPVHFCQLGGLLYYAFGDPLVAYPDWLTWQADPGSALMVAAIGVAALIPIAYVSFSALVRSKARVLTLGYIAANAALLIPVRSPSLVGIIAFTLLAGVLVFDRKFLFPPRSSQTRELLFTRVMMTAPFVLLIARSIELYELTLVFQGMMSASCALIMFVFIPWLMNDKDRAQAFQVLSTFPAAFSWILIGTEISQHFALANHFTIPLLGLPVAVIFIVMSVYAIGGGKGYRTAASLIAVGTVMMQMGLHAGPVTSLLCISVSMLVGINGYVVKEKFVFFCGASGFLFGVI